MTTSIPSRAAGAGAGFTDALLRFLASLLPWAHQADAAERWTAAARSASPRDTRALVRAAMQAVVTADRRSPADPRLAHVVALGRLRLGAAFSATSVLSVLSFGMGWVFGDPTVFNAIGGLFGIAAAVAAVALFALVVPVLGSRARHLRTAASVSLGAMVAAAAVSALAPAEASLLLALVAFTSMGCALAALSWSAHLGSAGRGPRNSFRIAPLAVPLVLLTVACGVVAFVVRPLLAAPGMSLAEIDAALAASGEGGAVVLVNVIGIAVMVVGVSATVVLLALGSRDGWLRPSSARALAAAAGVALILFEFLFSFGTVMNILDLPIMTGTDEAPTLVLGVVGFALAAIALLEGARHPYPSPRTLTI
ncbi:hypothetical protein ELQ90_00860 [Labedella phragmitis]|uniref:Uncharacterized protein n=1 Tax=Labedella phragmitis TaxID=2498849 RepID=A0A3S3ZAM5_9MICO|nr:hypothetical protein [Labedella phragmitis]RWZ52541.1 hypothetical protein ELQ90_00860 [Labedella phragmitis]